ncbi:rhamnulokinase [Spiractinospora alimapuensis]|uniref:rhamnulokinase n=1 Tax=Spiractinospora alimapuensis TaxID=2820884 RepID=UPI001F32C60D|nr:rhamnulokinase family protein [Spiractinospora alimapuensis]
MSSTHSFAAVDLGASSGRVVVGEVGTRTLTMTQRHRFPNGPVRLPDGLFWDLTGLYRSVLHGLSRARQDGPVSIGVDAWGADYGLLDARGGLLGLVHHHRDPRTEEVASEVVRRVGADELYGVNGTQFLPFNTIFQLAAAHGTPQLRNADSLLLVPDLVAYWLTGSVGAEITNASTTGLLDVAERRWSPWLADVAAVEPELLAPLREPGTTIGPLLPEVSAETGLWETSVTSVASHDTASAVAAVPALSPDFAYISCGTWSLVGVELPSPLRTEDARAANFTNELGLDATTRFLRNVMGMWLVQECARHWDLDESEIPTLVRAAAAEPPRVSLIDAGDPGFLTPGEMPARIARFCAETDQPVPTSRAAVTRCVLDSLALAHRVGVLTAMRLTDRDVRTVHIVGGGARNTLLCQLTADALGLPVLAGPAEATAIGNVLVQARASGVLGDLPSLRRLVATTQEVRRFEPRGTTTPWVDAARRLGLE